MQVSILLLLVVAVISLVGFVNAYPTTTSKHGLVKRDMGGLGQMVQGLDPAKMQDMVKQFTSGNGAVGLQDMMKSMGGGGGKGGKGGNPLQGIMGMLQNVMGGKDIGELVKSFTGGKGMGDLSKIFSSFAGGGGKRN